MDSHELQTARTNPVYLVGVEGWLMCLCLVLTLWYPATSFYAIFRHAVPGLVEAHSPRREVLLSVHSIVFLALAVFSFAAGVRLWLIKPDAVGFARRFLWTYLSAHIAYFVFWILITRPTQTVSLAEMGWYNVVGPIASFAFWYFYLEHSKRVRLTYSIGADKIPWHG